MLAKTLASLYFKHHFNKSSMLTPRHSSFSTQTLSNPIYKTKKSDKFLVYCNSKISEHGRNGNIRESEAIFSRMPHRNVISYTAMLTAYAQNGQIEKARKLFDGMPERKLASYNAMMTAYIRSGCVDEAFSLFSQMGVRNSVSYSAMITGFLLEGMFDKAEELYGELFEVKWRDPGCSNSMISGYLKAGRLEEAVQVFESMVERDVISWSSMVDGYCKKGKIVEARRLFDLMVERNVVTWTAMIDGYMNFGSFVDGFGLFLSMRREGTVGVNPSTLTIICEGCGHFGRYREGIQIHSLIWRLGFDFDVFLGNSIITMYCRFCCVDEANRIFQTMSKKDMVSWNALIAGYTQCDKLEEAYKLFLEMPGKDAVSWTTMIVGFSSKGDIEKSTQLFEMMPEKDDVAWTAVISGFVNNGKYEEAFLCYIEMLDKAVKPNALTFSSILSAAACMATLSIGLQIHTHVVKMDVEYDLSIQNTLVSMYSKCGNIAEAYRIFTNINAPNVVSFNSMITGFGQNGLGEEALRLFRRMQKESWKPNEITVLGVLSACSHAGLVKEAWECFNSMKSVYRIEAGPDHYACMVDLLGRAGLLNEAINLIHSMPFEPHSGVWGALLGSSKTHFRLDLATLAAQHLTELEPHSATPYVVLSDLYTVAGKRKHGDQLRMTKLSKRIKKIPGWSWIIVKDKVHLFLAGDLSIMESEDVKLTLWSIAKEMSGLMTMDIG